MKKWIKVGMRSCIQVALPRATHLHQGPAYIRIYEIPVFKELPA